MKAKKIAKNTKAKSQNLGKGLVTLCFHHGIDIFGKFYQLTKIIFLNEELKAGNEMLVTLTEHWFVCE